MVSSKLAPQDQIRYAALLQGRAQRIRVGGVAQTHSCIDVVNLYQHAWRATCSKETNLEARSTVWSAFDKALGRLPNRNTLIVMDLKNVRPPNAKGVGQAIPRNAGRAEPDQRKFAALLKTYNLTAVNTWTNAGPRTHLP